jgi:hypothetical protein
MGGAAQVFSESINKYPENNETTTIRNRVEMCSLFILYASINTLEKIDVVWTV